MVVFLTFLPFINIPGPKSITGCIKNELSGKACQTTRRYSAIDPAEGVRC